MAVFVALSTSSLHASIITWDGEGGGGLWSNSANWFDTTNTVNDVLPASGDTVIISNGDAVLADIGNWPSGIDITLSGGSDLAQSGGAIRMNGSTLNVGSGSTLSGGFWDLNNGTINFTDGAAATMNDWEIKGTNTFSFELGPTGFTTLNPNVFRTDGNNAGLNVAQKVALTTWTVDMAAYTGGVGIITLVDFNTDASRSGAVSGDTNNAIFQGATLNVFNSGSFVANLEWNDATEAVQLSVSAVPEPSAFWLLAACIVSHGGLVWRRRLIS